MLKAYKELKLLSGPVLWAAVTAVVLSLLIFAAACAVNPVTGEQQLALMSETQELQLGAQNYPQTTQASGGLPPQDPGLQQYVNQVGQRLARSSHRPNLPWEFNVVNTGEINAYALPGGKISITRGLITKMNSEDELAAVLGHEIGHVTARHAVSQYSRSVLMGAGLAGLGAALSDTEYGDLGATAAGVAGGLLMLSYSRDQERQSDELGYRYMTANRYNPKGMVRLFEIFQAEERNQNSSVAAFLSSHPLTEERINRARQLVTRTSPNLVQQPFKTAGFERALARQKLRAPAYKAQEQGNRFMASKQYRRAAQSFQQAIGDFGWDGLMHADLATAYFMMQSYERAAETASQGARISPELFKTNYLAGVTNLKVKRYNQAARHLSSADRIMPGNPSSLYYLAAAYEGMGSRNQAARIYQSLYQKDPRGEVGQAARKRLQSLGYQP
jgi:predicted Zn-dependent protease